MSIGLRNMFFSLTFTICVILQSCTASIYQKQQQKHLLPSAMVVGTVYCNRCSQQDLSNFSHFIPGASVAVSCDLIGRDSLRFQKQVKTNLHGVFRFRLPLELSRQVKAIKTCSVKLVRSSQYFCCTSSSSATSAGLLLKSRKHWFHVFSSGFFAFNLLNQPESRPSATAERTLLSHERVKSAFFFPPPIPFLPSPPNIGGIPLPSNPLQPPPPILPTLPFQPPPPPFIGFPPLPSLPPVPNIPPLPSLVPSPPPPAFTFLPIPFPPIFPGHPPTPSAQTIP